MNAKIILSLMLALNAYSFRALADDAEKSESTKIKHSRNPLTGTKKTTVEHKAKKKGMDGHDMETTTTDTTKEHTDGKVEKSTEKNTETKP